MLLFRDRCRSGAIGYGHLYTAAFTHSIAVGRRTEGKNIDGDDDEDGEKDEESKWTVELEEEEEDEREDENAEWETKVIKKK